MHYSKYRTGVFKRSGWAKMSSPELFALTQKYSVSNERFESKNGHKLDYMIDLARIKVLCIIPAAAAANNMIAIKSHIQYKN